MSLGKSGMHKVAVGIDLMLLGAMFLLPSRLLAIKRDFDTKLADTTYEMGLGCAGNQFDMGAAFLYFTNSIPQATSFNGFTWCHITRC